MQREREWESTKIPRKNEPQRWLRTDFYLGWPKNGFWLELDPLVSDYVISLSLLVVWWKKKNLWPKWSFEKIWRVKRAKSTVTIENIFFVLFLKIVKLIFFQHEYNNGRKNRTKMTSQFWFVVACAYAINSTNSFRKINIGVNTIFDTCN